MHFFFFFQRNFVLKIIILFFLIETSDSSTSFLVIFCAFRVALYFKMSERKNISDYASKLNNYEDLFGALRAAPQNLKVQNDTLYWTQGEKQEICYWNGAFSEEDSKEGDLSEKRNPQVPTVLVDLARSTTASSQLSKDEELLRERMRSSLSGITSYVIRKSDNAVFYYSQSKLFIYYTEGPRAGMEPLDVLSCIDSAKTPIQPGFPCMHISQVQDSTGCGLSDVIFVYRHNLYNAKITEQLDNTAQPIVVDVIPITTVGDEFHPCGVPDYITQEEFSRFTGHYENEKYVIFSYTDTSMTPSVSLLKDDNDMEVMHYPRVGDENSKTTIIVFDRRKKLFYYLPHNFIEKSALFPVEYITRFGFKDKDTIYVQVLDRPQEQCATLSYPISALCETTEAEIPQVHCASVVKAREYFTPLHVERKQYIPWAWTDVFPGEPIVFGKHFDLTIQSDLESKTGHYHLYIRPSGGSATSWVQLTSGAWNVKQGTVSIVNNRVAFIANAGDRLQRRLFFIPIPSNLYDTFSAFYENDIIPISKEGESVLSFAITDTHVFYCSCTASEIPSLHFVELPEDNGREELLCIDVPAMPWFKDIVPPPAEPLAKEEGAHSELNEKLTICGGLPVVLPTTMTVVNTRGVPISGSVFIPPPSAPSRVTEEGPHKGSFPLVIYVYGGPHAQLVYENSFDTCVSPVVQCLLQEGFAVAVVDGQMSPANGLQAHSICKKKMGSFETEDYVTFVKSLSTVSQHVGLPSSFKVDPTRVAIYGWSYGGYATLLAMSQAPDVFKMGFSGAPVGDWRLYDTGYTERYMGLLCDSETNESPSKAYVDSSIEHFVHGFPDEVDRVYISHGLLDENVHFAHSTRIISALIAANKPYSLLIYPNERHGLRKCPHTKRYNYAMMIKTVVEKL